MDMYKEESEWFWKRVDIKDDSQCWNFMSKRQSNKTPKYSWFGIQMDVNRIAYMLSLKRNKLPSNYMVKMRCENKLCCNPAHVRLVVASPRKTASDETWLCKCGCGTEIKRYNYNGQEIKYVQGHHVRINDYKEHFWSKVDKSGDCWLWSGCFDKKGYGRGAQVSTRRSMPAHRAAYLFHYGSLPEKGLCVCHHCDNPICVNPAHLFAGTQKDNSDDKIKKGRFDLSDPEKSKRALDNLLNPLTPTPPREKISYDQALEIIGMVKSGVKRKIISHKFGITRKHVYRISLGYRSEHNRKRGRSFLVEKSS